MKVVLKGGPLDGQIRFVEDFEDCIFFPSPENAVRLDSFVSKHEKYRVGTKLDGVWTLNHDGTWEAVDGWGNSELSMTT